MPTPARTKSIIENLVAVEEKKLKAPKSGKVVAKSPGKVKYGKK